jgi:hypothetical protein
VQFLDLELAGVLDSLAGAAVPAPPLAMCPVVDVDLGVLFDGLGLRALLPPFPGDVVDWTQLPDISFGGILPGVAQDELFCLLDSTAPEIVGLPDGGIIEPSPFDLAFDIVDPASGSLPGGNVDPTSVRILLSGLRPIVGPFEDTCTLSIEGVEVAPSADPLVPVDVTALLAPTQNVDGSVSVAGSLAVVTDSERGCFVDLQVKARDESGNGLSAFPTLQLITGGAIARFDPPGGDVPSPFTLTIVDEEPFGEGLGSVVLSAFACEEVIVNGTSLAGDLSQEDISSLLTFTPTGDDSFTLTGTIETGVRCHIGVFAEVLSGPFVAHFDGVSYQVFP